MKRYCLKPKAKETLKEFLISLSIIITSVLFIFGLIYCLPLYFIIIPDSIAEFIIYYVGILSWTALLSVIAIGIKRWLQSNIVEC